MRPPCEIVVRRLLPVLRALVAQKLIETYGWTQEQISKSLGVTQPAVSGYISLLGKEASHAFDIEEVRNVSRSIAAGIATGELTLSETVDLVCKLCMKEKSGGIVCMLHKQKVPELSIEACEACMHIYARGIEPIGERYEVLTNIRKAIKMIEESREFPIIIPEVRVNVVMAIHEAKTVSEVAGVPGRIVKVRDRAKAFMDPEFGSSYHLARVLLVTMEKEKKNRAVINIKFDDSVNKVLQKLGFSVSRFHISELPKEALKSDVPALWGIRKSIESFRGVPDIIIDEGGYGIEPMAYIIADSAVEAAKKAIQIAKTIV